MFGGFAEAGKNVSYALSVIRSVVCGIALVVWLFMRHYTYLMAVTVNLSVFHILKNAWLFVVLGFGRNVLSSVVTLACTVATFLLAPLMTIIFLPLFFYSLSWFCTVFTCYPVIKKYIIVPALEAQEQTKEEISASNEETDGGEREGPDVPEKKEEE